MNIPALAHRGYPFQYPENTMAGFTAALELGYTHLELDVQLSKDNVPVVIHDPTLDRTTNGSGYVRSYTSTELARFDAGDGERIPTLLEVLELAKDRAIVDIELKQMGELYPNMEQIVLDCIAQTDMESNVWLTSFDHYSMQKVRTLAPNMTTGLIVSGASPFLAAYAKSVGSKWIVLNHRYLQARFIEECRQCNIGIAVWTVDREEDMERIWREDPGIYICTNNLSGAQKVWSNI